MITDRIRLGSGGALAMALGVAALAFTGCRADSIRTVAGTPEDGSGDDEARGDRRSDGGTSDGRAEDDGLARILEGDPLPGSNGTYPLELYDRGEGEGIGERKRLWLRFDRPMDADRVDVVLKDGSDGRSLTGVFDADGTTFEVVLVPPDDDTPPLAAEHSYELDLSSLRGENGEPLAVDRVPFRTLARVERIEHACLHALFGPFEDLAAGAPESDGPTLSRTHRVFVTTLPGAGPYAGSLSLAPSGTGAAREYDLLSDREIRLTVAGSAASVVALPHVCAGLSWEASVTLTPGEAAAARIDSAISAVRLLLEPR